MINFENDYYYADMLEHIFELENNYPGLITSENIGISHDGRNILLVKLGRGNKSILCTAGVHGRESINPPVLMKLIGTYCEHAASNTYLDHFSLKSLLNDYSIYFIPMLNPDGYMIALRGFNIIKNEELRIKAKQMNIPYSEWKYNARGKDINRNFPSKSWIKKDADDFPGSEAETQALIDIFNRYSFGGYIDFHSRGRIIYYYREAMSKNYNTRQQNLGRYLSMLTGYTLAPILDEIDEGDSGGNTVHYFSERFEKPAFTIETVHDLEVFPLRKSLRQETYYDILVSVIAFCVRVFSID